MRDDTEELDWCGAIQESHSANHRLPLPRRYALPAQDVRRIVDLENFPSTRFFGSKRKQLPWVHSAIADLPGQTVLDACGGTGSVSLLLSSLGKDVTYNDVFKFNETSARALLSSDPQGTEPELIRSVVESVRPQRGFIAKNFKGLYFTDDENRWIDGFMSALAAIEDTQYRAVLLYCLFQACLKKRPFNLFHRANLKIRNSKDQVRFGNRTTWETAFPTHILQSHGELLKARSLIAGPIHVLPCGSAEFVKGVFDIVYLDPPYFHSHRYTESYLLRYHFLEGLARYDEWPNLFDSSSKIRQFRCDALPHEWRSKADFEQHLLATIDRFRESTVILSYVADAYPSEARLLEIFKSCFRKVRIYRKSYKRVLSVRTRTELMLVGEP